MARAANPDSSEFVRIGMTSPPLRTCQAESSSWIPSGASALPVTTSKPGPESKSSALACTAERFGRGCDRRNPIIFPDESSPQTLRSGRAQASGQAGKPGPVPMSRTDAPSGMNSAIKRLSTKCLSQHSARGTLVRFITSLARNSDSSKASNAESWASENSKPSSRRLPTNAVRSIRVPRTTEVRPTAPTSSDTWPSLPRCPRPSPCSTG